MTIFPDLQTIVSNGLCTGCGLCESVAGREQVEMKLTSAGYMRPQVKRPLDDICMARIRAVCPGVELAGPDERQVEDRGAMHDLWGPIRTMHRGWSTNDDIRFTSAAGGAMTALACYLLESGMVEAIVHIRASRDRPMESDSIVSTTPQEVRSGCQSRYGPAAPLVNIMQLLDKGTRMAVLGKPCDVAAIRKLGAMDDRVENQIPYLITIFCGGVPPVQVGEKIARYQGVEPEEISVFRWRGNGWPGPTHIETLNGRVYDMTYDEVWYNEAMPWRYDMQFRCKICPDATGELADVACPDSWNMVDGQPVHQEAPGANLFIARTRRGEELVAAAAASGAIHLDPFGIDELNAQHADHIGRKVENPARVQAMAMEGAPHPEFRRFRSDKMMEMAGNERHEATIEGTRDRIRKSAHREPLA